MSDAIVRPAHLSDLYDLARLFDAYRQFYEQPSDVDGATHFLRERLENRDSVIFIAHAGGAPAGFTQLYPSFTSTGMKRIFVLNDLFVTPAARKRGVGRLLLDAAAEHGRKEGAARLTLSTAVTNRPAQTLYESQGWVRDQKFFVYNLALLKR